MCEDCRKILREQLKDDPAILAEVRRMFNVITDLSKARQLGNVPAVLFWAVTVQSIVKMWGDDALEYLAKMDVSFGYHYGDIPDEDASAWMEVVERINLYERIKADVESRCLLGEPTLTRELFNKLGGTSLNAEA